MAVDSVLATGGFWVAAGERAIRTFAQAMLGMMTVSDRVLGILDVNWPGALSVSAFAALYSLVMSISLANTGNLGPSAVNERLAIRPQRGRHAVKDPEDVELEQRQRELDEEAAAEREAARRRVVEQLDPAQHAPPPLPPVQHVRITPGDTNVERDWRPDRAGYPTQDGIEHPAQQTGYRDPPTERNLRPVTGASLTDDLLGPTEAGGSHRGTP